VTAFGRTIDIHGHERLTLAADAMRQRLSHSGRPVIARTLSTPLLLKGLEFDNVLVPYASHFARERTAQAKLFYVAKSRVRHSLIIASSKPVLRFPVPQLWTGSSWVIMLVVMSDSSLTRWSTMQRRRLGCNRKVLSR